MDSANDRFSLSSRRGRRGPGRGGFFMSIAPPSGSLPARSSRGERDKFFVTSNRMFRFVWRNSLSQYQLYLDYGWAGLVDPLQAPTLHHSTGRVHPRDLRVSEIGSLSGAGNGISMIGVWPRQTGVNSANRESDLSVISRLKTIT